MPDVKFVAKGSRYNAVTTLLDGDEYIFMQEGVLPLYVVARNTGNVIKGNGSLSGVITLYDSGTELNMNLDGNIFNNIDLGGGRIILSRDLNFGHNVSLLRTGTVVLSNNDLKFGSKDLNATSTVYWDGSYGIVELNSNVGLYSTWTFSGNCIINGNNNILIMNPTARIDVERGSTLRFRNTRIKSPSNIRCLDDAGTIIFDNVKSKMAGDWNFEKGSMYIDDYFDLRGSYTFAYQSSQQSTIGPCAYFYVFPGTTFSYDPPSTYRNLISMNSCESRLILNDASLHSTTTGLPLTGGILQIDGECTIRSDATIKSEGITFGDGTSADNDILIDVMPESTREIMSGYLVYNNVN